MYLKKSLELTEKSLEFDRMLALANHLSGKELELHRERMDILAGELQKIRQEVADCLAKKEREEYRSIYLNPLP